MSQKEIQEYVSKEGTVKIAGHTQPRGAGRCAFFYLKKGFPVEFFCIGASANQQAMKSMGVFKDLVEEDPLFKGQTVAFQPIRYSTDTVDPTNQEHKMKDAVVWATLLVSKP